MPDNKNKEIEEAIEKIREIAESSEKIPEGIINAAIDILKAANEKSIENNVKSLINTLSVIDWEQSLKAAAEWEALKPFIERELEKPEYKSFTFDYVLYSFDINGVCLVKDPEEARQLTKLLNDAKTVANLPVITINKRSADKVDYPLDKVNSNVWKMLTIADKTGQLTINFDMRKNGRGKPADLLYSINFDGLKEDLKITKKLTAFDKRCYISLAALYNNNCQYITISQIYATMGNTGRPSANDIKKINDSITKMNAAHIYINNSSEHTAYKKYASFEYDASLLPMERTSIIANGQISESAIFLYREPPLMTFARIRKQITTVSKELLQGPKNVNKTEQNLQIDDYLIERISRMKNNKENNKILYDTIFNNCNMSKMQRTRAKDKILKYLEHYKERNFIKDYKIVNNGITIKY